jgi:hypothetical protein
VAVRLRERVEELRVRHSASVPGPRRCPPPELFARSGDFPLATASGIDPAALACRGVPAWLPRLCRTWRRRLSSHRNTATPTARWRLRWILQSSEEPTDVVDVQGGRPLSPRSARHGRSRTRVSWTADGRPRHGRRDWMPDLEVALLGDSYPGVPVGQAAEFWSSSRAADELRPAQPCLEMDVRARGCRPTGCGSLIRGGALCEFRRRV